jgi:hypothetical protein
MNSDREPRPGTGLIGCGAVFIGLSISRLAIGWAPDARWRLHFEIESCVIGLALVFVGWSRLRKAKAGRPDLTWMQFLHTDLITWVVVVVSCAVFAAIPAEQREELLRQLKEFSDAIMIARGRP